jgi:hypothetical protein
MQSKAPTVAAYLASLPPERRSVVERVHKLVLDNLDPAFKPGMAYGMIGYALPFETYPMGYHCDPKQPLGCGGLAAQKNAYSLYLMCLYGDPKAEQTFRAAWAKTGKKLDMGKCCIRFKSVEDLATDVIAKAVRGMSAKAYIERYESLLGPERLAKARKAAAKLRPEALGPGALGSPAAMKSKASPARQPTAGKSPTKKRAIGKPKAARPAGAKRAAGKKAARA